MALQALGLEARGQRYGNRICGKVNMGTYGKYEGLVYRIGKQR